MSTDDFVKLTLLRATGEIATATFGDDDYSKVILLANKNIDSWAKEFDWDSLYDPAVNCGTISAGSSADLDSSIRKISDDPDDFIQITRTDGIVVNYQTVPASQLKRYTSGNYCARIGSTLRFNRTFKSTDKEYGGSLTVPSYLYAPHLKKTTDIVPVDNPDWLVAMTAADWVQSDITLAQNRDDFLAEAADLMNGMKQAGQAQLDKVSMTPVFGPIRS